MEDKDKEYFSDFWFKGSEHLLEEKAVQELAMHVLSLREEVKQAEEGNTPMYCPSCSSCGEEGCCSPDNCQAVKCLYEKRNLHSYHQAQMENSILWSLLELCESIQENRIIAGKEIKEPCIGGFWH